MKKNNNVLILGILFLLLLIYGGTHDWFKININPQSITNINQESGSTLPSDSGGNNGDGSSDGSDSTPVNDLCRDSDGGINYDVWGFCESDLTMTGLSDTCSSNTVKEVYCDNNLCKTIDYPCPVYSVCINGVCQYPPCSTINPAVPENCNIGVCDTGSCQFVPATLVSPARCSC